MLNRKFKFYVPGTNGGVSLDRGLQTRIADDVCDEFAVMFGGSTVTEARGVYLDGGRLIREPIVLVESFTDEEGFWKHKEDVLDLAERVANQMGQQSVAVEVDGELYLVESSFVEEASSALAA